MKNQLITAFRRPTHKKICLMALSEERPIYRQLVAERVKSFPRFYR